jgi:hypothetical protein
METKDWKVTRTAGIGEIRASVNDAQIDVWVIKSPPTQIDFDEANSIANLIATAPELLFALQDLVRFCKENNVGAELELAEKVLEKACGFSAWSKTNLQM